MDWAAVIGLVLLAVAGVVAALAMLAATARILRVRRRFLALGTQVASELEGFELGLARLGELTADRRRLLRRPRLVLRWARHPLTAALIGSYRRRRG